jgi:16S rRNA (guanine527-N7)-methyltransferase
MAGNASAQLLQRHYPQLGTDQLEQLGAYEALLLEWNQKINLVSRKDTDRFAERHLLHSLAFRHVVDFRPGTVLLDVGTGGGLPGVPLAIAYPDARFVLCDSILKKTQALSDMVERLSLANVRVVRARAEALRERFDFVVGRAVTQVPQLGRQTLKLVHCHSRNNLRNGLLYLTGSEQAQHLPQGLQHAQSYPLSEFMAEEAYREKVLLHLSQCASHPDQARSER